MARVAAICDRGRVATTNLFGVEFSAHIPIIFPTNPMLFPTYLHLVRAYYILAMKTAIEQLDQTKKPSICSPTILSNNWNQYGGADNERPCCLSIARPSRKKVFLRNKPIMP